MMGTGKLWMARDGWELKLPLKLFCLDVVFHVGCMSAGREWDGACPATQLLVGHKVKPTDAKDVAEASSLVNIELTAAV